jgi:hypothetical protein
MLQVRCRGCRAACYTRPATTDTVAPVERRVEIGQALPDGRLELVGHIAGLLGRGKRQRADVADDGVDGPLALGPVGPALDRVEFATPSRLVVWLVGLQWSPPLRQVVEPLGGRLLDHLAPRFGAAGEPLVVADDGHAAAGFGGLPEQSGDGSPSIQWNDRPIVVSRSGPSTAGSSASDPRPK